MKRLAILASGGGSNAQAIIDACNNGVLKGLAEVVVVITNNPNAQVLDRANLANIPPEVSSDILSALNKYKPDIVCLAGYMKLVPKEVIDAYTVINIHPALLPKYGGKGMYGRHVHEAVIKAGENISGATVHFANENYDEGSIIMQREVNVLKSDTPESLAARVLEAEHKLYPAALRKVIKSKEVKGYIIHVKGDEVRKKHMDAQIKDIGIFCDFILDGNQEEITQEVLDTAFSGGFRNVRKPNGRDKHFNLGTASCTYKHMQALRDIVKNNIPYGVVFENDIILDKKFTDILFKAIAEIKERSLKNLVVSLEDTMLKYVPRSKRVKGQLIYPSPTGYIRFAGAYLFDLEYAKNMLNYVDTNGIDDVIDWLINNRQAQGGGYMGIYWLHPTIAVGGSVTGDIGSYFTNRRYYGFFRKMSRLSQKVYKTILWNLR